MHITLPPIPVHFLGPVLGLGGLASGWRICAHLWQVPGWIGEGLALLAFAIWAINTLLYGLTWLRHRDAAQREWLDPGVGLASALLPMSTLIAAMAIAPYLPGVAFGMLLAGLAAQVLIYVFLLPPLWLGQKTAATITPIIFMPAVGGSFICAIACGVFEQRDWGNLFLGIGILSWMGLESVLLQRLFTLELPERQRSTLGIFFAPPSSSCVAYLALTSGPPDIFAQMLFGYACFLTLILARLSPWLLRQPFATSYWTYSFGIAAMPLAALRFIERGETGIIATLAIPLFVLSNILIVMLVLGTLRLAFQGRLLSRNEEKQEG